MVLNMMRFLALLLLVVAVTGKSVEGPRRAVVNLQSGDISGKIVFEQASSTSPVKIRGTVHGLEPGLHGMHVHEGKTLGTHCEAVGPHFNPTGKQHGGPRDPNRHVGDLGNIKTVGSTPTSRTDINILSSLMSLYEENPNNVLNRALVIHAGTDDLGRGQNLESLKSGNSGAHIACGLVKPVEIEESGNESYSQRVEAEKGGRDHHGHHSGDVRRETSEEKPWKEWTPSYASQIPSNLNLEGFERPDLKHHDGFELKNPVPTTKVWKVGRVYEYEYSGFISTGMMGIGPKISGGSLSGKLVVEPIDEHTINMALESVNGKMFNEDVLEEFVKADPGQQVRIMDQEHLEKPIQLKITNGRIETVLISKDEPLWTVNFKRGLAAQLQLQLDSSSGVFHKTELNTYYAENTVYHTMEGCTSGECQTWYHISRLPLQQIRSNPQLLAVPELCENSPVYEIVKNRDFDKCRILPIFNYINTPGVKCGLHSGAACENANSHVDMVRIVGCKVDENTFVVQRIKVMDRLVTKPFGYETEAMEGLSIQNLELVNIKSGSSKLALPRDVQPFKTLTYSFDEEHKTVGPKMSQPSLHDDNNPLIMEVHEQVALKESERLLTEVTSQLASSEHYTDPTGSFIADKLNMLHKALSNLNYHQLTAFVSKFWTPNEPSGTTNQILVEALVMTGTNPSLMIVREWILNGHLQGEQAVSAVTMLPSSIKTPTKEILSKLIDLLKSEVVANHQQLKFATALSVSRIVYQACVNTTQSANMFPKMAMGEFCSVRDPIIANQLVPWLSEQLKKAHEDVERIAMLAALGNIGHEVILPSVLPHISSCEPGTRFEAEWYERHRRSSVRDEEEPLMKKEWRQKWLAYKKKHGKEASVEELMERFEAELKGEKKESGKGKSHHGKDRKKMDKEELKSLKKGDKEAQELRKKEEKEDMKSLRRKEEREELIASKKQEKQDMKSAKKEEKSELKSLHKEEKEEERDIMEEIKRGGKRYQKEAERMRYEDFEDEEVETEVEEEEEEEEEEEMTYGSEFAEDQASCNILRTKAIYALSTLAVDKNEMVGKILMPIYFNKAEETEVRLAALSLLFVAIPPMAFWERVALSTWTESNDQVNHYIYTTISSLVANKDPKRRDVTQRAEAVLPMMKPMRWTSFVSSNYLKAGYEEKTRLGYLTKSVNFPGFESFFPSNHYDSLYVTAGPWFSRIADIAINSKQPEKFIDRLLGKPSVRSSSNKDEKAHVHPELEQIHRDLKIEARATGQPEIFIYVNVMDNYQRFFAITPHTVERFVENLMSQSVQRSIRGEPAFNLHKFTPLMDVFIRVPSAMGLSYSIISQTRLLTSLKANLRTSADIKSVKSLVARVEGDILPVINFEMTSKINVETPWTRSYPTSGVHLELVLASPGRLTVAADLNNGKFESSWEFPNQKLRLFRWAVIPFTTIRRVGDYTPSLLMKETKPIILLDRPITENLSFGQRALGLNFVQTVRGDVQAIKAPSSYDEDWFGFLLFSGMPSSLRYQERNLYLDNTQSETKTIKTIVSIATKESDDMSRLDESLLEDEEESYGQSVYSKGKNIKSSSYDQRIKEERKSLFQQSERDWEQEHERKFQNLFRSMVQPSGYSVEAMIELTGSSGVKPRRYGTSMSYGVGDYGLSHRGQLMMEKRIEESSEEDNFVFCVDLEAKSPKPVVVRREEFLRDDLSRTSSVKIGFGKSCTDDRKIVITTKMARSEEEIQSSIESKWQDRECAKQELFGRGVSEQCLSTRRLASILNKGVITIDYNEMPSVVRNMTIKASNLFNRFMGAHMSDNQVDVSNTPNQIRIETVYYPIIGSMDLRVYKPKSNTFYHGIDIHPVAEAVLPFNPRLTAFRAIYGGPGLCLVDRNSVTTYDGLSFNVSSSGCNQLVTKDCSGRYKMAVLSRQDPKNNKIVTVLLNNEKIELSAAAMRVKVNEKEVVLGQPGNVKQIRDAEGNVIANIRKTSDDFIELDSPSHWIRVTVDANEVIVLNSPIHRGRLCGLCGSQTGFKVTDLTGPRKCSLPEDLMDVAYELRTPAGCRSSQTPEDREILARLQDRCMKEEATSIFGLTDSRPLFPKFQQHTRSMSIRSVMDEESDCELFRNRMIHRGRKRCFSLEPAIKCSEGCQPTGFQTVKMGFHCVVPGPLSDELKEAMAVRPLDELAGKEVSTLTSFRVPTGCAPASSMMSSMDEEMTFSRSIKSHRMH